MLLYALQLPIMVSKFQHSNYFMDESKKKKHLAAMLIRRIFKISCYLVQHKTLVDVSWSIYLIVSYSEIPDRFNI